MTVRNNRIMRTPEDQEIIMRRVAKLAVQFKEARDGDPDLTEAIMVGRDLALDYIHDSFELPRPHAPKLDSPWRKILDGDPA